MKTSNTTAPLHTKLLGIWAGIQQHPALRRLDRAYRSLDPRRRGLVLFGVAVIALVLFSAALYALFNRVVAVGFLASMLAGLATGIGALSALSFTHEVPVRIFNSLLGAAAGVMLAATAFSLIVPGTAYGDEIWPGRGALVVALGMIIGALFLDRADRRLPTVHFASAADAAATSLRKIWLFIIAITIHNFPEGLAVGVSFGSGDLSSGLTLAFAIGLQNIPEGMAVAVPLVALGYERRRAVLIGTMTGLVEPVGGLLGAAAVTLFHPVLPLAMGFAAGAMLFVISEEIIPETQSKGKARYATFAVMLGFVIMMLLDRMVR